MKPVRDRVRKAPSQEAYFILADGLRWLVNGRWARRLMEDTARQRVWQHMDAILPLVKRQLVRPR